MSFRLPWARKDPAESAQTDEPLPGTLSALLNSPAWPLEDDDVFGAASIDIHCGSRKPLETLGDWGITGTPVVNANGDTVGVLVRREDVTEDLEDIWSALAQTFSQHGLWPTIVQGLDGDLTRPWLDDLREWEVPSPAEVDVLELLNSHTSTEEPPPWNMSLEALSEGTPSVQAELYLPFIADDEGLLITSVSRPSEVPLRLSWEGACNYSLNGNDISAVLQRWETQFGAILMRLGFDTVDLQVARPPQDA